MNKDIIWDDEKDWLQQTMLEQANNEETDDLFESMVFNLISNVNLEPEFPELP